jgi:hypothetical protein
MIGIARLVFQDFDKGVANAIVYVDEFADPAIMRAIANSVVRRLEAIDP